MACASTAFNHIGLSFWGKSTHAWCGHLIKYFVRRIYICQATVSNPVLVIANVVCRLLVASSIVVRVAVECTKMALANRSAVFRNFRTTTATRQTDTRKTSCQNNTFLVAKSQASDFPRRLNFYAAPSMSCKTVSIKSALSTKTIELWLCVMAPSLLQIALL